MHKVRINIWRRCFWLVLALHMLNFSIDAPDKQPDFIAENLNFNDIESVGELVLEKIIGIDNAIVEQDEPDDSDGNSILLKKVDFFCQNLSVNSIVFYSLPLKDNFLFTFKKEPVRFLEVIIPPPEFLN